MKTSKVMKWSCSIVLCSTLLFAGAYSVEAWDGKTKVEPKKDGDVYQIGTAEELAWLSDKVGVLEGKYDVKLTSDIDLEGKEWTAIGTSTNPYNGFFDGDHHSINGLNIEGRKTWQGLFGKSKGTIKDINLDGSINYTGNNGIGSVVGWNFGGTIDNVTSSVVIKTPQYINIGGIAGQNTASGMISNSEFTGSITAVSDSTGGKHVGGIVGENQNGDIVGNINRGNMLAGVAKSQTREGGIVGNWVISDSNIVANNINYGNIESKSENNKLGGIVGYHVIETRSNPTKYYLFNNINFGTITGNPLSKDINDIISPTLGDKGDAWTKNNLNLVDATTEDIKNTMTTLNDFDGSEFEKVLPKSAAFTMTNEQLTLVSAAKRSKEEPIDPEKLAKAQKELDELVAKVNKFYLIVPKFGEDKNINELMMKRIQELGNDGVNVTVKSSSNLERIKEDGAIDYFYRDPNNSGNGLWFEFSDIVFELSKDGAKVETIEKRVRMDWDLEKLEAALKENVVDALTDDVLKNKNASLSEVETDLELPKYVNNIKWATITWTSSNPSAIAVVDDTSKPFAPFNGKVKQAKETQNVTLTATIKNNRGTFPLNLTKSFDVTVKGLGNSLSNDMEELMATYYTDEKLKDSVTKEVVDLNHVSNDITLPTPSETGIPGSFNYKFEAESDTNDTVEAKGFRVKVYRPLPGEQPVKTSFKVKMIDRKTDIFVEKTYHMTVDPLTHEEIAKEVTLMDFAKADFQRALNNAAKTSKAALLDTLSSEPTNKLSNEVDSNLTPMRQAIYSKNGTGFEWIYDMDKVTTSGISPVSVDVTRPSEQWDKFRSSNNVVIQHESLYVTPQKYNQKVRVNSVLSSDVYARYAEKYPENKEFQKLSRQPVSAQFVVLGFEGESPFPPVMNQVKLSVFGDTAHGETTPHMGYTPWVMGASAKGDEYTTAFDIFEQVLTSSGYSFVGSNYVSSITSPEGVTLAEKANGSGSGWMYAVNGVLPEVYAADYLIHDGDHIQWFYTDDHKTDSRIKPGRKFVPEKANAMNVMVLINDINTVTLEKENKIVEARQAYDALPSEDKEAVTNLSVLEKAEATLSELKETETNQPNDALNKEAAKAVSDKINALGTVTLESKKDLEEARTSYAKLNAEAKALVNNLDVLEKAEETLKALEQAEQEKEEQKEADKKAAKAVSDKINALGTVTLESKKDLEEARTSYAKLNAEAKALVNNLDVLEKAEETLKALEQAEQEKEEQKQADKEAAKVVSDKINALGTITLDSKKDIEEARSTYGKLNAKAKELVSNLAVLEKAEETLKALESERDEEENEALKELQEALEKANKEIERIKNELANKTTADAKHVMAKINSIGTVTVDKANLIAMVRQSFNVLSPDAQALVTNEQILIDAEDDLLELLNNKDAAKQVSSIIDTLKTPTLANAANVEFARMMFNQLSDEAKAQVTNQEVLTKAVAKIDTLFADVDDVISMIELLPQDVSLTDKETIKEAREAFKALPKESKPFVYNVSDLSIAELKLSSLKHEDKISELVSVLITDIDALTDITADSEAKVSALRSRYAKLPTELKVLVTNYHVLEEAELAVKSAKEKDSLKANELNVLLSQLPTKKADLDNTTSVTIKEVKDAYAELSEFGKKQVNDYDNTIQSAEALEAFEKEVVAANHVIELINRIKENDEDSLKAAREAYDRLSSTGKELVTNYSELEALEQAKESDEPETKTNRESQTTSRGTTGARNTTSPGKAERLPKTGESTNSLLVVLIGGVLIVTSVGIYKKKRTNN